MQKVTFPVQLEFQIDDILVDENGKEESIHRIDALIYEALSDYKEFAFDVADKVFTKMEGLSSSEYKLIQLAESMSVVLGKLKGLQGTIRQQLSKELQDELKEIASEIERSLAKFNLLNYRNNKSI